MEYESEPQEGAEDAPLESEMQNDWTLLNQNNPDEEPEEALEEAENKTKHRQAMKKPQALYSYVGNGGSRRVNISTKIS